jgi:hypothetical protein
VGEAVLVSGLPPWDGCGAVCGVICVDESCCWFSVAARISPGTASTTQQQTALAIPPNPVILSGTERQKRKVKSKDPEVLSIAMQLQGVRTSIYPLFWSLKPLNHHRESSATTLPATTISTQRSQANQ